MAKQKSTPARKATQALRPPFSSVNEGDPLEIQVQEQIVDGAGETLLKMSLDLGSAPAPRRRFVADGFSIVVRDETYHLIFLQHRVDGNSLRAMVDIQMAENSVRDFLQSTALYSHASVRISATQVSQEPDQTVALAANFVRAAVGPGGACIDFYLASAFSMVAVANSHPLHLEAEVRIITSQNVHAGFIEGIRSATSFVPPDSAALAGQE